MLHAQCQRKMNSSAAATPGNQAENSVVASEDGAANKTGSAEDGKQAESDDDSDEGEERTSQPNNSAFAVHDSDAEVTSLKHLLCRSCF